MIVEVLSDHPSQELRRVEAAYQQHQRCLAQHEEKVAELRARQRASQRWWQLARRVRHGAELRARERHAPQLDPGLDARRAQQASGVRGEEALTAALGMLSDDWTLFRGYANRRGEVDHLLVGPGGVWAIEVKVRAVRVHVDGDRWWFEKFDRYGNRVEQGSLANRRGRSWGRQVSEIASELRQFLTSRGQRVDVRTAVVLLHDRAELGSHHDLGVDVFCVGPDHLLERIAAERLVFDRASRDAVAGLVRRDHAFHAKRRRRRRGSRS